MHCNIPVSLLQSTQNNPKRSFCINVNELLSVGFKWEPVKEDLENIDSNINVKSLVIARQNMLFDLNKELMTLDINEIINSLNYLKDFARINNNREGQMPVIVIHDTDDSEKFEIK